MFVLKSPTLPELLTPILALIDYSLICPLPYILELFFIMFVLKSPTLPALLTPLLALIDYNPDCVKLLRYTNNEHLLIQYKKKHFLQKSYPMGKIFFSPFLSSLTGRH